MNKSVKHTLIGILIGFLVVTLQMTILFGGVMACRNSFNPYNEHLDGYFQYIIVNGKKGTPTIFDKKYVAIIGFSALGKEQEIIDIPREIGGIEVRYIGYRKNETFAYSTYYFGSENLKKVYIHENIERIYDGAFTQTPIKELMICAAKYPKEFLKVLLSDNKKFYIYKSIYNLNELNKRVCIANIELMNNYSTTFPRL